MKNESRGDLRLQKILIDEIKTFFCDHCLNAEKLDYSGIQMAISYLFKQLRDIKMNLTVISEPPIDKESDLASPSLNITHDLEDVEGDSTYHRFTSPSLPKIIGKARNKRIAYILFLEAVARHHRDLLLK